MKYSFKVNMLVSSPSIAIYHSFQVNTRVLKLKTIVSWREIHKLGFVAYTAGVLHADDLLQNQISYVKGIVR